MAQSKHADALGQAPHSGVRHLAHVGVLDCVILVVHNRQPHGPLQLADLDAAPDLAIALRITLLVEELVGRLRIMLHQGAPRPRPRQIGQAVFLFGAFANVNL